MNSTNIKVLAGKSQSAEPVSALLILDSQMAACNYGVDHPWRLALADVIAESKDSTRDRNAVSEAEPIRKQAYEVASRIGNIAILVEAIFDKLDEMDCNTPTLHKVNNAITCFANSAMESAQFIRAANEQILKLTNGGLQ